MEKQYGRITGWGHYVPEKVITNHDLEALVETSHEWIVRRTGIEQRRVATGGETTATMAVAAARQALEQANLLPTELDLIILATTSPDQVCPPAASVVQHGLGATNVPAFLIQTGCTGFVYALTTAFQFIAGGAYRKILVAGSETISRFVNWHDRATCVLFGDAAAAVVVEATPEPCGLEGAVLGSDGSGAGHITLPAGGAPHPWDDMPAAFEAQYLHMNGREVYRFATRTLVQAARQAITEAGLTLDDVDWIIPHQANLRIIQAAAQTLEVPLGRFIINLPHYGNTCAASIPLALSEALQSGQIQPDDRVLLVSFGAGLTWAAAVVQLAPVAVDAYPWAAPLTVHQFAIPQLAIHPPLTAPASAHKAPAAPPPGDRPCAPPSPAPHPRGTRPATPACRPAA